MTRALVSAFASALLLLPSVSLANGFELGNGVPSFLAPFLPSNFGLQQMNPGGATSPEAVAQGPRTYLVPPILVSAIRSVFDLQELARRDGWTNIEGQVLGEFRGVERLVRGRDGVNRLETQVFWPRGGYVQTANLLDCRQCRTPQAYFQLRSALEDYLVENGDRL